MRSFPEGRWPTASPGQGNQQFYFFPSGMSFLNFAVKRMVEIQFFVSSTSVLRSLMSLSSHGQRAAGWRGAAYGRGGLAGDRLALTDYGAQDCLVPTPTIRVGEVTSTP